jgi:hypothetical protein
MARKRNWTKQEYLTEAREFVACYGSDYCWDEFVYEYCSTWEHESLNAPDGDELFEAIMKAQREVKKALVDGDLVMD